MHTRLFKQLITRRVGGMSFFLRPDRDMFIPPCEVFNPIFWEIFMCKIHVATYFAESKSANIGSTDIKYVVDFPLQLTLFSRKILGHFIYLPIFAGVRNHKAQMTKIWLGELRRCSTRMGRYRLAVCFFIEAILLRFHYETYQLAPNGKPITYYDKARSIREQSQWLTAMLLISKMHLGRVNRKTRLHLNECDKHFQTKKDNGGITRWSMRIGNAHSPSLRSRIAMNRLRTNTGI